jgi:perosamine synthetase
VIPVSEPLLGEQESRYVAQCLETGWISSAGPFIERFEQDWSRYCGRKYGVCVSSGTAALQVALSSLDLQPGDEVIMPAFTIISCVLAVIYSGGTPVLVDAEPRTWTMDPTQVEEKITPRTKAILAVHIYGHPADMDPLLALADRHELAVIEDAAEAHGAEYLRNHYQTSPQWRRCGSFGAASCFSFYANKLVTTGEGGMVLTDDARQAERFRSLRNLCFQPSRRFMHEELGFNFRFTNLQAALGIAQLERMEQIVEKKRWIGRQYSKRLEGIAGLQLPVEASWARSVYWMYGIVLSEDTGITATDLAAKLNERDIETRPFFLGMHEQPALLRRGLFHGERYPVTERLACQGLYLPSGLALTDTQLEYVAQTVREILQP